jgi:predicted RNA-binding Zn ribbon-like protein
MTQRPLSCSRPAWSTPSREGPARRTGSATSPRWRRSSTTARSSRAARPADLHALRRLRPRLAAAWQAAGRPLALAALTNDLLGQSGTRPWLTNHDGTWHLHVTRPDAPLPHRVAAEAGLALADLVCLRESARLRQCLAPACRAVLFDLSRNRSRLYCDTGNCGNRQHVAAYRARQPGHENRNRPDSNSQRQ